MVTNTVQLRMGKRERRRMERERQAKCIGSLTARLLATLNDPLVPFPLPTFTSTSPHSTSTFLYVVSCMIRLLGWQGPAATYGQL